MGIRVIPCLTPSLRWGLEISNYYTPFPWLTINADFATSQARFNATNPTGPYVPEAVTEVVDAGVLVDNLSGWQFSLYGVTLARHLTSDDRIFSSATSLFYLRLGYQFSPTWSVGVDVYNLFNTEAQDIAYYYASRLKFEPPGPNGGGYNDIEFHPAESRSIRVTFTARF